MSERVSHEKAQYNSVFPVCESPPKASGSDDVPLMS